MESRAPVFNIQKFCTHDGEGIRTTVFFKGCNMVCKWCANPESQEKYPELLFYEDKCRACGRCIDVCPEGAIYFKENKIKQYWDKCINCGKCTEKCCFDARAMLGEDKTVSQVFEEIKKDKFFYETSKGGVTFSGGEPILHLDFIGDVSDLCRNAGIHVSAETCGCFPEEYIEKAAKAIDTMLFDLKIIDEEKHKEYCGCTNKKLLRNFRRICKMTYVQPRVPIIPGINDSREDIGLLAEFLKSCDVSFDVIHILPYHTLGLCKYKALGRDYTLGDINVPSNRYMNDIKREFESHGFQIRIGG